MAPVNRLQPLLATRLPVMKIPIAPLLTTDSVYVARCDEQGRILESEQAFVIRALRFFLPVLSSLKAKAASNLRTMRNRLTAWKEELQTNVNANTFIRFRLDTLSDTRESILVIGRRLRDVESTHPRNYSTGRSRPLTMRDEPYEIIAQGRPDGEITNFV